MNWEKQVVRGTLEGAGEYPGVQLQFLLQRLEQCPDSLRCIANAIADMGEWFEAHARELEAEGERRKAAQIVPLK